MDIFINITDMSLLSGKQEVLTHILNTRKFRLRISHDLSEVTQPIWAEMRFKPMARAEALLWLSHI